VQFIDVAASAAVWFRLIAAPVPSTGLVARSPSGKKAVGPLAKVAAGGTTAAATAGLALPLALALAEGQGVADAEALATAAVLPEGAGLPDGAGLPEGLADGEAQAPVAD
jgi:hypothetical protein